MACTINLILALALYAEAWAPHPSLQSGMYSKSFARVVRNVPRIEAIKMAVATSADAEEEVTAIIAELPILGERGHYNKAVRKYKLLRKMGGVADGPAYRGILKSCAQARVPQISEKVVQDMLKHPPQDGVNIEDMRMALLACARGARPVEALQIFEAMKKVKITPDLDCFHMAIQSCVRAPPGSKLDAAVNYVLKSMQAADVKANFQFYGTLLQVLVRARKYKEALATFEVLCIEGTPTGEDYRLAINSASKLKDVSTIKSLLGEMLIDSVLAEEAVSALPKATKAVADSGDWRLACKLLERIDDPNMFTYHSVIAACGRAKNSKMAITLFNKMCEVVPPSTVRRATMNAVLNACQQTGDKEGAEWIINMMAENGMRVNVVTYNIALSARAKVGDYPGAIHLLGEMESEGVKPSVVSFATAINAAARGNSSTAAVRLLNAMEPYGVTPNEYVFTSCIAACQNDPDDTTAAENAQVMVDRMAQIGIADLELKARLADQVTRQLHRDPTVIKAANRKLDEALLGTTLSGRQMTV